jgi:hypothetical protein
MPTEPTVPSGPTTPLSFFKPRIGAAKVTTLRDVTTVHSFIAGTITAATASSVTFDQRSLANLPYRHSLEPSEARPAALPIRPKIVFRSTDRPRKASRVDMRGWGILTINGEC